MTKMMKGAPAAMHEHNPFVVGLAMIALILSGAAFGFGHPTFAFWSMFVSLFLAISSVAESAK